MTRSLKTLVYIALGTWLGACDEGDPAPGTPGNFVTGDDSRTVSEVSEEEWDEVDVAFQEWAAPRLSGENLCRAVLWWFIPDTTSPAACEIAYNTCLQMGLEETDGTPLEALDGLDRDALSGCNATVADLEACMAVGARQLNAIISETSCDNLNPVSERDASAVENACQNVRQNCPNVLDLGDYM